MLWSITWRIGHFVERVNFFVFHCSLFVTVCFNILWWITREMRGTTYTGVFERLSWINYPLCLVPIPICMDVMLVRRWSHPSLVIYFIEWFVCMHTTTENSSLKVDDGFGAPLWWGTCLVPNRALLLFLSTHQQLVKQSWFSIVKPILVTKCLHMVFAFGDSWMCMAHIWTHHAYHTCSSSIVVYANLISSCCTHPNSFASIHSLLI